MVCKSFVELLDLVVTKSKMNWCDIRIDRKGNPYIYDIENGCKMGFKTAVEQIYEGACDLQNLSISEDKERQFYTCCHCLLGD